MVRIVAIIPARMGSSRFPGKPLNAMLRFYQRTEWLSVLRLFANIDEDEVTVVAETVAAMRDLVESRVTRRGKHHLSHCQPAASDSVLRLER